MMSLTATNVTFDFGGDAYHEGEGFASSAAAAAMKAADLQNVSGIG